jgi:hypothetical protein
MRPSPLSLIAERLLASFGDLEPFDFERPRAADYALNALRGESGADQLRQPIGRESMQQHDRFGAARSATASE